MRQPIPNGTRFGKLVVQEPRGQAPDGSFLVRCRCDCGGLITLACWRLRTARKTNCGCERRPNPGHNPARYPAVGTVSGRLTVTGTAPSDRLGRSRVRCDCSCGTKDYLVLSYYIKDGRARSCGCLNNMKRGVTHDNHV